MYQHQYLLSYFFYNTKHLAVTLSWKLLLKSFRSAQKANLKKKKIKEPKKKYLYEEPLLVYKCLKVNLFRVLYFSDSGLRGKLGFQQRTSFLSCRFETTKMNAHLQQQDNSLESISACQHHHSCQDLEKRQRRAGRLIFKSSTTLNHVYWPFAPWVLFYFLYCLFHDKSVPSSSTGCYNDCCVSLKSICGFKFV